MSTQNNWRWCNKCQGLFFAGNPSKGTCPADQQSHDFAGSGNYSLVQNIAIIMPTTYRMHLSNRRGRCVENFKSSLITKDSVVHIAVSEASGLSSDILGIPGFSRFVGNATITINNVSPGDGVVYFVVTVDWEQPLNIVTDITVMPSDPPVETVVGQ